MEELVDNVGQEFELDEKMVTEGEQNLDYYKTKNEIKVVVEINDLG